MGAPSNKSLIMKKSELIFESKPSAPSMTSQMDEQSASDKLQNNVWRWFFPSQSGDILIGDGVFEVKTWNLPLEKK